MKKIVFLLIVKLFYSSAFFSQINSKTMDLRDAFVGNYKTIGSYPANYHILVQKISTSIDSLIIHDSLWSTGATTGCPVNCYQHRVKLNNDSTWYQYGGYYGHFKKTDTIYLHFFMPGSPPQVFDYYGKRVGSVGINELTNDDDFIISPNPSGHKIYVSTYRITNIKQLVLFNIEGIEILSVSNNIHELDVSTLSDGMYFLQIQTINAILTKKIVVQH